MSGRDETALSAQAGRWAAWLTANPETSWSDVVRTAALHRTHFDARAAIRASGIAEAAEALSALAEGRSHPAVSVAGMATAERRAGKLAMLFTGQGSQRLIMGRDMYGKPGLEAFTQAFDAAAMACDMHLERSLTEVMWSQEPDDGASALLHLTRYTQPALFVLETALFRQWQAWGVQPDVLLGNSIGELVAAHVAGVLSLEDAAALVCARGRLMDELATAGGAMASLQASEEEVRTALGELPAAHEARVDVAGLNTPTQTVVSGDAEAADALVARFEAMGRKATRLTVSHAFHSPHMDGMLEAFGQVAAGLTYVQPSLPVISNVTGKPADVEAGELVSADYWVKHVRQAVRFVDGVGATLDAGATTFLECGPDGVLCGLAAGCVAENEELASQVAMLPSLRKNQDELPALVSALSGLHVRRCRIDWQALYAGTGAGRVDLPTYAFQRQRYRLEAARSSDTSDLGLSSAEHPLLDAAVQLADSDGLLLTGRLSLWKHPWLADHTVFGTVLLPGTGMLELALAAARAVGCSMVSDLTLAAPLVLPQRGTVRVQLRVEASDAEDRRAVTLYSRGEDASPDTPWTRHATGVLAPGAAAEPDVDETLLAWPPSGATALEMTDLYPRLAARGLAYGPAFQGLTEAWRLGEEIYARVVLPAALTETAQDYGMHPALLDAALHPIAAGFEAAGSEQVLLPFAWSDVTLHATGASELRVRLRLPSSSEDETNASLVLADPQGQPVATMAELRLRRATAEQVLKAARTESQHLYRGGLATGGAA